MTRFSPDQILSHHKSTLVLGGIVRLVGWEELLVGYLVGFVLKVDLDGAVKKILLSSGFGLYMILVGYLGISGPCTFQLYCGT